MKIPNSNAGRFINAYNRLDKGLRDIYNFKPSLSFSDIIRKSTSVNYTIKKFEDDLIDYGRLRNSIIHRSSEEVIAEPHDDVVSKMEMIVRLVTTPPKVINTLSSRRVYIASDDVSLKSILVEMFKTGYSNIPYYIGDCLVGVITRKMIIEAIGEVSMNNGNLNDFISKRIADCLKVLDQTNHYEVISEQTTIDNVLYMFQQNKKLTTIIVTPNGTYKEMPTNIIVTADIIDLQGILDNY